MVFVDEEGIWQVNGHTVGQDLLTGQPRAVTDKELLVSFEGFELASPLLRAGVRGTVIRHPYGSRRP